jgi:hypothetical protein
MYAVEKSGLLPTDSGNSTQSGGESTSAGLIPDELETTPGKFGVMVMEMAVLGAMMGWNTMRKDTKESKTINFKE